MERIKNRELQRKKMSASKAADFFKDGMNIITSGFTPSGYPKAVPLALAQRCEQGDPVQVNLISGASVGDELDGALTRAGALRSRMPYQTNADMRSAINEGRIKFFDQHLSHVPANIRCGFYGEMDIALVEALSIEEDGSVIPTMSVGLTPTALSCAKKIIIEVNHALPMTLEGIHDIYSPKDPPHTREIPIYKAGDRIGNTSIPCDPSKIVAIVETNLFDSLRPLDPQDDTSKFISRHLIKFLEEEVTKGRLPKNLLPLQSGVGAIANSVLAGLKDSPFDHLSIYSEVIQDAALELLMDGKVEFCSGTSFTPSLSKRQWLFDHLEDLKDKCVLRPMEISNHPEIIRRLGLLTLNTAIEIDLYGHVNSTHILGSKIMNGIGGSGDFARNGYLSIFSAPSTAMGGNISTLVPMVSHVDHSEHDVDIFITEQGLADLRGKDPVSRAVCLIEHCAHPTYKKALFNYLENALSRQAKHEPHVLEEALSWHWKFSETGSML